MGAGVQGPAGCGPLVLLSLACCVAAIGSAKAGMLQSSVEMESKVSLPIAKHPMLPPDPAVVHAPHLVVGAGRPTAPAWGGFCPGSGLGL